MRTSFIIICLLGITFTTQAQFRIGGHAGYTRAWQNYGDVVLPDDAIIHIHSFNASVVIDYQLTEHFSLGVEPGFVRRGAACVPGWNDRGPIFRGDSRFSLDYVELPVLLQRHFGLLKGRLELIPSLGYSTAVMVNATEEIINLDTKDVIGSGTLTVGRDGSLNRFDHGPKGGMRVGWNFGKYQLYAKTSFYMALRNAEQFNSSKNRAVNLSLGYIFTL